MNYTTLSINALIYGQVALHFALASGQSTWVSYSAFLLGHKCSVATKKKAVVQEMADDLWIITKKLDNKVSC